jgi:hypothetical protein
MAVQVNDPRALVPLLEQSLTSFTSSQSSFAAAEIINAGLRWPVSGYWVDLALGWIEQGHAIDHEIRFELQRISKDKFQSQSARHRAIALLNRSVET